MGKEMSSRLTLAPQVLVLPITSKLRPARTTGAIKNPPTADCA
jgi:hypothetical protein